MMLDVKLKRGMIIWKGKPYPSTKYLHDLIYHNFWHCRIGAYGIKHAMYHLDCYWMILK